MSLPYIYYQPQSPDDWQSWGFNHAANHYDWIPAIQQKKNIIGLQQFVLNPIDPENVGMWLYNHQAAHTQANLALGTHGYDLLSIDFSDPEQFAMWIRLNAAEHQRISGILGIG
jgi:hypothetical protein